MERFKAIEKELKTKAFSKEGLGLPSKVDPEELKKQSAVDWINETVDRLNQQIDGIEAQQEQLQVVGKRGKKGSNHDQLDALTSQIDRHRKHVRKLEVALRMLENGFLDPDQIEEVKENVEYYIDSFQVRTSTASCIFGTTLTLIIIIAGPRRGRLGDLR
jgi:CCR4-NOT transcription complex subunit 3